MFIQKNPYDTSDIEFTNLPELIKPRNFNQHNSFNINYSTYYGIEYSLKRYLDLPQDFEIKAFFEHGVTFTSALEAGFRVHECLPTFTSSKFRQDLILSQKNNNGAYAIGPYIAYADLLLGKNEFSDKKGQLGKNLLVFPAHSTAKTQYEFNLNYFTQKLLEIKEDFDSVTVCLFWADVNKGFDKYYKNLGFNVVTAGYFTDPLFLSRLKTIIELSDETVSNGIGSHTGYCIYMNKPHLFVPTDEKLVCENDDKKLTPREKVLHYLENQYDIKTNHDDVNRMKDVLSKENQNKKEVFNILNKYYGFDQVKTRDELKNIAFDIEKKFSKVKFYLSLVKLMKYYSNTYYKAFKFY